MILNHTSFQDLLVVQISHKLTVSILFTFQRKWSSVQQVIVCKSYRQF